MPENAKKIERPFGSLVWDTLCSVISRLGVGMSSLDNHRKNDCSPARRECHADCIRIFRLSADRYLGVNMESFRLELSPDFDREMSRLDVSVLESAEDTFYDFPQVLGCVFARIGSRRSFEPQSLSNIHGYSPSVGSLKGATKQQPILSDFPRNVNEQLYETYLVSVHLPEFSS